MFDVRAHRPVVSSPRYQSLSESLFASTQILGSVPEAIFMVGDRNLVRPPGVCTRKFSAAGGGACGQDQAHYGEAMERLSCHHRQALPQVF